MQVYDVSVKRTLYTQDSSLPKSIFLGVAAKAGRDATRMRLGEDYVFFFSKLSKGNIKGRVIYMIEDPPLDRTREKEVSELIARIRNESSRKQ